MAAFLDKMNLILNAFISWISTLSSWMAADILLAFVLALFVFSIVIKLFRKLKHIF